MSGIILNRVCHSGFSTSPLERGAGVCSVSKKNSCLRRVTEVNR